MLFDLGDLTELRPAKLLKVSHAFISHTHIDHFIGFDTLLRVMLNRQKVFKIFGPPGFLANVQGKLSGYTWNLTAAYPFSIQAAEVHPDRIISKVFPCHQRFSPQTEREEVFRGVLAEDPQMQIIATHLDHLIPSLAFAIRERFHINVHQDWLDRMGLLAGPWLKELKMSVWRGEGDEFRLQIPPGYGKGKEGRELPLGLLKEGLSITPGQKIAYVSDCCFSEENIGKILSLAEGADLFFCEAGFLEKDRERAEERAHLTARQAGELARRAKVKKLHIFHFSPKYLGEESSLHREAEEAFQGRPG